MAHGKIAQFAFTLWAILLTVTTSSMATTRTRYLGGTLALTNDAETVSLALRTPNGRETFLLSRADDTASPTTRSYAGFSQRRAGKPNRDRAALIISGDEVTVFFSSRRTGRPASVSFSLNASQPLRATLGELRLSRVQRGATIPCANEGGAKGPQASLATDGLGMYSSKSPAMSLFAAGSSDPIFTPPRLLQVAAYADGQFASIHGRRTSTYMETSLSAASSLYLAPLGIRIKVVSAQVATAAARSAEGEDAEKVLEQFRTRQVSSFRSADLHHLFTGKSFWDSTIGIAYVAAACTAGNKYAVGLSKNVKTALQPLVAAHELAHGLSAVHDSESLSIMNPTLTTANNHFSDTTKTYLSEYISGPGSCVAPTTAPETSFSASIKEGLFSANVVLRSWGRGECTVTLQGQSASSRWRTVATRRITISTPGDLTSVSFTTAAPIYTERRPRRYPLRIATRCDGGRSVTPTQLISPASAGIAAISSEPAGDWLSALIASFRQAG